LLRYRLNPRNFSFTGLPAALFFRFTLSFNFPSRNFIHPSITRSAALRLLDVDVAVVGVPDKLMAPLFQHQVKRGL
jgi:hypothetical protein